MSIVHVAVGVIFNEHNQLLIALRDEHLHQGGLWEFPGGKVEPDENVQQALARELNEELAIQVHESSPLIKIQHNYGDKQVLLDVWTIDQFSGEATGVEGQTVKWIAVDELNDYSFPEANREILEKIIAREKS